MQVNAHKDQMVGNAVNDAALAAFPARQARELAIRIVECVRADMEHHASDVDAQIAIVIKMPRDDTADAGQQRHSRRRHFEMCKKLGQPKSYGPIKVQVENSLHFACFVSGFDARSLDLCRPRHQICGRLLQVQIRKTARRDSSVIGASSFFRHSDSVI